MKNKRKIILVSNTSWSLYNFRLGLIRALTRKGFDITVVAPRDRFTSKLISEGITYREIFIKNYSINPIDDLKIIFQLSKIYRTIRPQLIFHYTIKPNIYGSIAAFWHRIPSISITTGLGHLFEFKNFMIRWITVFLYRFAAYVSKELWFLNENDRDVFVYKRIVRSKKARVLKSEGINTEWFSPKKNKSFQGVQRFLFAGRLIWDKGIREFVEAAKIVRSRHPRTRFEMIGFIDSSNPKAVSYDEIAEWQKQKIIRYLGETSDIRPVLQRASCLVFPSFYREGISRILMEAAAMETPIITTDNVGCRDLVDDGVNGFITKPKSVEDLVHKIELFLALSEEDKIVMGKLGRKKMIRQYDESLIINEYMEVIHSFLPNQPKSESQSKNYRLH
ncbi:glycosyltransferase family 4 protein [Portibacter marinus]|uniref:glycosyltransferase family 4 protein n=1 Tax=Portibacter marinus TaxID=2898660 RepID=UPI001F2CC734|nr:glycosyltransferase family 4 protein [Portibacter marinus]